MRKYFIISLVFLGLALLVISSSAEDKKKIPSIKIKDLNNKTFDTKDLGNDGKPFVISFWATWCKPCLLEMSTMNEVYEDWTKETGVKLFAVSIDDSRSSKKVAPFVKGKKWKFDVLLDENSDFLRGMNANHPPHTFLCNGNGEVIYQHVGFAPGDEEELYKQIKSLIDNK